MGPLDGIIYFQTPWQGQDTFHYTGLFKSPSRLALNTFSDAAPRSSLASSLFQWLSIPQFFLRCNLNLPFFSLKSISLRKQALGKRPFQAFLWVPFQSWKAALNSLGPFSLEWATSTLSACSHMGGAPSSRIYLALIWTRSTSFLC